MEQTPETLEYLRNKAALLPKTPGVYIMQNKKGDVIYVGKSRALKNRVSQYFHGSHDIKTSKMASNVFDFRYITCDSEMEALVLENNLIKQYTPKYNILLKDAKSYPYIKITDEEYPRIIMTRKRNGDGQYFGPYSGTATVYNIISTIERALGLPTCKKHFPEDIKKSRPCVYKQIGRCIGVCTGEVGKEEYSEIIKCAKKLLRGDTAGVEKSLLARMTEASDDERFEEAARCRDAINSLKKLSDRQKTELSPDTDCDVIALATHEGCDCAALINIRGGIICDSEYFMFGADEITGAGDSETDESPFPSFIVNLYKSRESFPKEILLSFQMNPDDTAICERFLTDRAGHRITLRTPQRGEAKRLCLMAERDAIRHSETRKKREDSDERILVSLSKLLGLEVVPERIEAYDISNLGSEHITAGMVVSEKCRFKKSDYRSFNIKSTGIQDDYASMREVISRRIAHIGDEDTSLGKAPDLILLDGGSTHVSVVRELMRDAGCDIPVFGMVKDEHHKTRTIVSDSYEVSIAREPEVFRFIYRLQEEVHRFTVSKMSGAKSKTLRGSTLEKIPGIGPAKAKKLLSHFPSFSRLKVATKEELQKAPGISEKDAATIFEYFNKGQDKK